METEVLAALDVLSPPFLSWFSREECPTDHLPLLAAFAQRGIAGWILLPWTAKAAIISGAAVGIAATAVYCWPRSARGEPQEREQERIEDSGDGRKEDGEQTDALDHDGQPDQVFYSNRSEISSPLTPRVKIIPSSSSSPPPPSSPASFSFRIIPSTTSISSPPPPTSPPSSSAIVPPPQSPQVDVDSLTDTQFSLNQFYSVDGEFEGVSISFLDSDDEEPEVIHLAPPTNSTQKTMEFSLSYGASSGGEEEEEEDEDPDEGSYSLVHQSEQEKKEIVTQTIVNLTTS